MELKHEFNLKKAVTIKELPLSRSSKYIDENIIMNEIGNGNLNTNNLNSINNKIISNDRQSYNIYFNDQNVYKYNEEKDSLKTIRKTESLKIKLNNTNFNLIKDMSSIKSNNKNISNISFNDKLSHDMKNINNSNKNIEKVNNKSMIKASNGIMRKSRFLQNYNDVNHSKKIVFADEATNCNIKIKEVKDVACLKNVYAEEIKIKTKDPPCFEMCISF